MSLNQKTAVILLGGDVTPTERLKRQVTKDASIIIAADGGMRHAEPLGISPTIWLGDFDSKPATMDEDVFSGDVETHNPDKAQTDGELAIDKALILGATRLILVGALGGERSDHMLMHMSMALALATKGIDVFMTSGTEEAIALATKQTAETIKPDWPNNAVFSLIGFTDMVGVTLKGMKWPLDKQFVPFGETLTLSNEIALGDEFSVPEITLEKGRAIAMVHNLQNTDIIA